MPDINLQCNTFKDIIIELIKLIDNSTKYDIRVVYKATNK